MVGECRPDLTAAEAEARLAAVRGHVARYPLQYLSESGFNFTLLTWGASIVVQEAVFH